MTVILVLATFLAFVLLDYLLRRRAATQPAVAEARERIHEAAALAPPTLQPAYVEGFLVPERLTYHPGHSWLLRERRHFVRVGADEFASTLVGPVEKIELPKPGRWVRQGQTAWSFYRDCEKTEMVSPIEGEIVEVNPEVANDPSLLRKDPYGRGWLMTVFVPDEESTARNLLPTSMVRTWMRDAVERLYARQPQLAGAVAADGGRPADDLFAALPDASWKELTREFFLT
jgi:glycine cleavage system H lipoate-binding protein